MEFVHWALVGAILSAVPAVWFLLAPSNSVLRPLNDRMASQVTESAALTAQGTAAKQDI